jgi:tryptophan 2,3-dioxygenase
MHPDPVSEWLDAPDPATFPYDWVVDSYRRVGKHFVAEDLLKHLSLARDRLYDLNADRTPAWQLLCRFLGTALDKFDERYDYPTYLALDVLDLPRATATLAGRDRLLVRLATDALAFELAALDGRSGLLPEQRPDRATVGKRFKHTLRAVTPALGRLGLADQVSTAEPEAATRQLVAAVRKGQTEWDRRVLQLSMLPVYVCHDEWLFIRVLQMFETAFAMLARLLEEAVRYLSEPADWAAAVRRLDLAAQALRESAPLFSLLATMQVESFRTFRNYTEGASAIQSRGYKTVEALCARPDAHRLDSMAYRSVPELRLRVLAGQTTLDEAFAAARASGRLGTAGLAALTEAMRGFSEALLRWRQTHYRLAVRMLGERRGTGYTEGPPYLEAVRELPVFPTLEARQEVGGVS